MNHRYTPATNTWTALAPMPTGRTGLAAAVVGDAIFAIGGRRQIGGPCSGQPRARVERYNIATNTWSRVAALPARRSDIGAIAHGGRSTSSVAARAECPPSPTRSTSTTRSPTPGPKVHRCPPRGRFLRGRDRRRQHLRHGWPRRSRQADPRQRGLQHRPQLLEQGHPDAPSSGRNGRDLPRRTSVHRGRGTASVRHLRPDQ